MAFRNIAPIWQQAPILRLLLPFAGGIFLFENTDFKAIKLSLLLFIIAFITLFFLCVSYLSFLKPRQGRLHFIGAQMLLLSSGFAYCAVSRMPAYPAWFGHYSVDSSKSLARVREAPIQKHKTIKYEVDIIGLVHSNKVKFATGKGFVYAYRQKDELKIKVGDTIILPGKWQNLSNAGNPFDFNFKQYCERKNIFHQQFLNADEIVLYNSQADSSQSFIFQSHQYCLNILNKTIKDTPTKALLKAMLLGDEQEIDPNVRQAYSDTGIIHIISISGAHVALLFIAISYCFRWIRQQKYAWIKFLISLAIIWFYVVLAGSSTPALRAAIMFTILAVGNIFSKQSNAFNQLFLTAFLLLLIEPMWLFTIGFQLSFAAVLSLLVFYKPIVSRWIPSNKIILFLWQTVAASIAAEILVAPLVAFYFHSFPPMFIVANVLASAAMSLILGLGFLLLILGKLTFLASAIATSIEYCSTVFHYCIGWLQQFNINCFKTIYISTPALISIFVLISSVAIVVFYKTKFAMWAGLFAMFFLSVLFFQRSYQISNQQKLIVYNTSGATQCEWFRGNTYQILNGDNQENFTTRNAHIGFGTNKKTISPDKKLLILNSKKILLIDSNTKVVSPFHADILILSSCKKHSNIEKTIANFSPAKIILGNNLNKIQAKEWINKCISANVQVHHIKTDGAFIFP